VNIFYSDSLSSNGAFNCLTFMLEISNRMVFVNGKYPRTQLVQVSMEIHNSRTSNLERGTLPYMAPLNTSAFQLSSMFIPCILWQFLLPFLIRGLVFSPLKIFTAKNKIHAPKGNQCTTLWHFNGFLSHEMINLFFLIEKRVSGRDVELIFIVI